MLLETKYFDLLEREKLGQILDEQKLGMSGVVDDATAVEVGKLLGVNAMVFGEVTVFRVEPDEFGSEKVERKVGTGKYEEVDEKNIFTGKTRKVKREIMRTVLVDQPYRIRRGTVSINFRVVDVQTGRLLAVHSDSRSYNSGKVNEGGYRTLPPEGQILDDLSRTICQKFVRTIAPYYSTERRPIESGKGPIQVGKKYAEAGLWPEALDAWQKAVVELPKEPAAHYNLGLAHEILGDLDKAEASFKTAVSISQKRLYMDAIQRIRQTRVENEKLREQLFERQQSPPVPPGP
jgi:curli biogenesis system outer membrane secretion channel CsgG